MDPFWRSLAGFGVAFVASVALLVLAVGAYFAVRYIKRHT